MPILQVCHHIRLLVRCIRDGPGEPAPVLRNLLINPRHEGLHHRFFVPEAAVIYLLVGQPFFPVRPLVFEQFVAVEKALHGRIREILFFSFRDCLLEVSPDVGVTAAPFETLEFVIPCITVHDDVGPGFRIPEKFRSSIPVPGRMVLINDDGMLPVIPGAEQPDIGFRLRPPVCFLQHLDGRFIPGNKFTFCQQPVEISGHWREIVLCAVNGPVRHRTAADFHAELVLKLLFLTVIGHGVDELRIHDMSCQSV